MYCFLGWGWSISDIQLYSYLYLVGTDNAQPTKSKERRAAPKNHPDNLIQGLYLKLGIAMSIFSTYHKNMEEKDWFASCLILKF